MLDLVIFAAMAVPLIALGHVLYTMPGSAGENVAIAICVSIWVLGIAYVAFGDHNERTTRYIERDYLPVALEWYSCDVLPRSPFTIQDGSRVLDCA